MFFNATRSGQVAQRILWHVTTGKLFILMNDSYIPLGDPFASSLAHTMELSSWERNNTLFLFFSFSPAACCINSFEWYRFNGWAEDGACWITGGGWTSSPADMLPSDWRLRSSELGATFRARKCKQSVRGGSWISCWPPSHPPPNIRRQQPRYPDTEGSSFALIVFRWAKLSFFNLRR